MAKATAKVDPQVVQDIAKLMKEQEVPAEEMSQCLSTGIYDVGKSHAFMASILQCLNITYSHMLPTAGVCFNGDQKRWDLLINPHFFCKKMTQENRKAVLLHELAHICNRHPMRVPFLKINKTKRSLMNIAADMSINQFIQNLPRGCPSCPPPEAQAPCTNPLCPGKCIDVADYHDEDEKTGKKTPWPTNKTMEYYYEKLIQRFKDVSAGDDGTDGECGTCKGTGKDGKGDPCPDCKGTGKGRGNGKGTPREWDQHQWDESGEEAEMLDATEELVKRAMIKQGLSYDNLPGFAQDLLDEIKARKSELNYRAIIMSAIKRHASGHERKSTWTRPSKRYGVLSPGSKISDNPKLRLYLDSSGSISTEELNEFLDIVDDFLRVGSRKCEIAFFHSSMYLKQPYKLGERFDRAKVQSGGTDLTGVFEDLIKHPCDLCLIITDGCYGDVAFESMLKPNQKLSQTLFLISRQGQEKHPICRLPTVKVPESAKMKGDRSLEAK